MERWCSIEGDTSTAKPDGCSGPARASTRSLALAGAGAFVVDVVFGYGPSCLGFYLILLSYDEDLKNELVPTGTSEMLGTLAAYLFFARLLLNLWLRRRFPCPNGEDPASGGADRAWARLLDIVDFVAKLVGRPVEAVAALAVFLWAKQMESGFSREPEEVWLLLFVFNLVFMVLPWVLGFRQVWEGNGQTIGRSVFGLQMRTVDGAPAGFVRLLLRDGVARPVNWIIVYTALALILGFGFYAMWIVVPLIWLVGASPKILLRPFEWLWLSVADGEDSTTLHDLLMNTVTTRAGSTTSIPSSVE